MSLKKLKALAAAGLEQPESEKPPTHGVIIQGASPPARDVPMPVLSDAIIAMLIMSECTATWQGLFWVIRCKKTGQQTNMPPASTIEELWMEGLAKVGAQKYGSLS